MLDRLADQVGDAEQREEDHEEDREQNHRYPLGDGRNIGEADRARDQRDHQENHRISKHRRAPDILRRPTGHRNVRSGK